MTTANKLTFMRILLVPAFLIVLYLDFPRADWVALAIFILAAVTDTLDGYVARSRNQVTNLGKFMDPLADKILVVTAMCWFIENGRMAGWLVAAVLIREFAVSGLRLMALERGKVIAAAWSGKIKTAATMVCIALMLVFHAPWLDITCQVVILATTLVSGAEYFAKNWKIFRTGR